MLWNLETRRCPHIGSVKQTIEPLRHGELRPPISRARIGSIAYTVLATGASGRERCCCASRVPRARLRRCCEHQRLALMPELQA